VERLDDEVLNLLAEDAQLAHLCMQTLIRIRDGFYDPDYVNALFQKPQSIRPDQCDAYWFLKIHQAVSIGDVMYGVWDIGAMPGADADVVGNTQKLAAFNNGTPFEAVFDPHRGYTGSAGDGSFAWTQPIMLDQYLRTGSVKSQQFEPMSVPFEVGQTAARTTFLHLLEDSGVARWPYGSTRIFLFIKVNTSLWNS
jgi:hypothetical protein